MTVLQAGGVALLGLCAACVGGQTTDLVPEGPPMIRQLMVVERAAGSAGTSVTRPVIAFGSHPDATGDEQHPVQTAVVSGQRIRVVIDELLRGNSLEEIQCAAVVDEDAFSRIPVGATPEDIARCSGDPDTLTRTCKGAKAVCIRRDDGVPVGILDRVDTQKQQRPDGIPDVVRFIDGAAVLRCTADDVVREIPVNQTQSYWQPSGSQHRPLDIDDGLRGLLLLGPAVVLVPRSLLPTSSSCHVAFAQDVVDKSGIRPCAPADGDVTGSCEPGDTSLAAFTTEPIAILQQTPAPGATGVPRALEITLRASAPFGPATQASLSPAEPLTVTISSMSPTTLTIRPVSPLSPNTRYTLSLVLRDSFGVGPAAPASFSFTTGGMLNL